MNRRLLPLAAFVVVAVVILAAALVGATPEPEPERGSDPAEIVGKRVIEIEAASGPLRVTVYATPSGTPLVIDADRIVLVDEDVP